MKKPLVVRVTGQAAEVEFTRQLDGDDFVSAIATIETIPPGTRASVDLSSLAYVDSFESLVLERLLDRASACSLRCTGVVREVLELTIGAEHEVTFQDP